MEQRIVDENPQVHDTRIVLFHLIFQHLEGKKMAFKKGESGNINGRPAGAKSKSTIAKSRKYNAVKVLEGLMLDTNVEPQCRLQAACAILFNNQSAV